MVKAEEAGELCWSRRAMGLWLVGIEGSAGGGGVVIQEVLGGWCDGENEVKAVAWLHWAPEEDLESGGARGKDGTALLDFRVGLIHI